MRLARLLVLLAIASGCAFFLFVRERSDWPEAGPPALRAKANDLTPSQVWPVVSPPDTAEFPHVPSSVRDREASVPQVTEGGEERFEKPERILSPALSGEERAGIEAAWRNGDLGRAAALAAALSDPEDRRNVLVSLLEEWAKTDPEAAVRFAQGSPAGIERREMLGVATRTWSERDLIAASDWLEEFEGQPDYDLAVAAIANSEALCLYQPETALNCAESITTSAIRWEVMSFVVTLWAQRNPIVVRRYIETSAVFTFEERARMLAHVDQVVSWAE